MLTEEPELGYRIVGVVGPERGNAPWEGLPYRTQVDEVVALARETGADGLLIVAGALSTDATSKAVRLALAAGLHVQLWPALMGLSSRRVQLAPVSGLPVLYVAPESIASWQLAIKRIMDIAISLALLPFVAPVLIAAAVCIKLEDRGPLLHQHAVIGRYGVPTTVLKLRTMVPNASQMMADIAAMNERTGGPLFKASNDPRVTKVGRILRATSIDELPQLWNVLTGKMSLVGPRFALPHEVALFDEDLRRRHKMRPGMTGLWQTEARDNPSFSAYRRLDLLYVDNWSLSLDLAILGNTAHAVSVRALRAILPTLPGERDESGGASPAAPSPTVQALARVEAGRPQ
jgi:lipopolysaccharide/colanic/teichoic acid biosynthesis glycosyltransferase